MRKTSFAIIVLALLTACGNDYGKKISKDYLEVYYKDGVTEDGAQKVLNFLYPQWKNAGDKTPKKSIQLAKNGDTTVFRMVVIAERLNDLNDRTLLIMVNTISDSVFAGKPVNIELTDKTFKTLKSFTYKKAEEDEIEFGEKINSGNVLVYNNGMDNALTKKLADYINTTSKPQNPVVFQLSSPQDGLIQLKMISDEEAAANLSEEDMRGMAEEVSKQVLQGKPLEFHLTDQSFNTYKKYTYNPG